MFSIYQLEAQHCTEAQKCMANLHWACGVGEGSFRIGPAQNLAILSYHNQPRT